MSRNVARQNVKDDAKAWNRVILETEAPLQKVEARAARLRGQSRPLPSYATWGTNLAARPYRRAPNWDWKSLMNSGKFGASCH